jgi:hypothetical protein
MSVKLAFLLQASGRGEAEAGFGAEWKERLINANVAAWALWLITPRQIKFRRLLILPQW